MVRKVTVCVRVCLRALLRSRRALFLRERVSLLGGVGTESGDLERGLLVGVEAS